MESYTVYPFVTGRFHLASRPSGPSARYQLSEGPSCSRLRKLHCVDRPSSDGGHPACFCVSALVTCHYREGDQWFDRTRGAPWRTAPKLGGGGGPGRPPLQLVKEKVAPGKEGDAGVPRTLGTHGGPSTQVLKAPPENLGLVPSMMESGEGWEQSCFYKTLEEMEMFFQENAQEGPKLAKLRAVSLGGLRSWGRWASPRRRPPRPCLPPPWWSSPLSPGNNLVSSGTSPCRAIPPTGQTPLFKANCPHSPEPSHPAPHPGVRTRRPGCPISGPDLPARQEGGLGGGDSLRGRGAPRVPREHC